MANFTEGLIKIPYYKEEDLVSHKISLPDNKEISFLMYGETTEFRVRTLLTKEPETIKWIDSFDIGDVLWDIGANIGCYSLYAASRGLKAFAFEPSPVNYWLLTSNVVINKFDQLITAFNFGLSNLTEIKIWSPNIFAGSADNQINIKEARGGDRGGAGLQVYSIDELIATNTLEFPQHIKIDVDGIERLILEGGLNTLSNPSLKSVLCEINENDLLEMDAIMKLMVKNGFSEPIKRHPPYFDKSHYAPTFNYIFYKT